MEHKGIEYTVRARPGPNQWVWTILPKGRAYMASEFVGTQREAGISIEALAEDIARRTLLQSLNVRPALDAKAPKPACSRWRPAAGAIALELLVKQRRMTKTQPVPCIVRVDGGLAEEDSLAENVHREALHPLGQQGQNWALDSSSFAAFPEVAAAKSSLITSF
jgi:hypothetical protein